MNETYTGKEITDLLDITPRRLSQLVQAGVIGRLPDGLYDKTALHAYIGHLRQTIAHFSGKSRWTINSKPIVTAQKGVKTPDIGASHAALTEFIRRWAKSRDKKETMTPQNKSKRRAVNVRPK